MKCDIAVLFTLDKRVLQGKQSLSVGIHGECRHLLIGFDFNLSIFTHLLSDMKYFIENGVY